MAKSKKVSRKNLKDRRLNEKYGLDDVLEPGASSYPAHLRGLGVNRYGGNQLGRERGLRGTTNSSTSSPGRAYTEKERKAYEFQLHLLAKLGEAEKLANDTFGGICNLITDLGAVQVARMLVDPTEIRDPPTGFVRLLENSPACLTIEQAIVDFAATGLFTDEEVEAAKARLAIFPRSR